MKLFNKIKSLFKTITKKHGPQPIDVIIDEPITPVEEPTKLMEALKEVEEIKIEIMAEPKITADSIKPKRPKYHNNTKKTKGGNKSNKK